MLKARAQVLDISPDGKYVVYYGEKMGHKPEGFISVSRPPFFTAVACFVDHHRHWHYAKFQGRKTLQIGVVDTHGHWEKAFPEEGRRIDPGCPLDIRILPLKELKPPEPWTVDGKRNRKLWSCRNRICTTPLDRDEPKPLVEFTRDVFEPILAPEWARHW